MSTITGPFLQIHSVLNGMLQVFIINFVNVLISASWFCCNAW